MKIVITSPYFYPKVGGMENYVYNIARGLNKGYGWDVVVITSNHEEKKYKVENIEGIKVYRLPYWFRISNTPINPLWYFSIKKILKKEKPDVINAHSPVPYFADITALASGNIPFFLTYHAGSMKKIKGIYNIIIGFYEKIILPLLFSKAKKIIIPSKFVGNTIASKYTNKTFVISPGVNMDIYKPYKNKPTKDKTVIFIGRYANMYPMKGLFCLLDALKELPGVKLKVVGEKLDILEKNVEYVGIKKGKELAAEIQKSDVLVLAPLAAFESFGMVLIEAMACKVPVIGSSVGGIPEIIEDKVDGLLVKPDDVNSLLNALKLILFNPAQSEKLKENGYRKVKTEFTWSKKVELTHSILTQYK